jgi:hypothetical protein
MARNKKTFAAIVLGSALIVIPIAAGAQMTDAEIDELQARIDAQGLDWTAGRTSMTDLSDAQRRAMLMPTLAEQLAGVDPAGLPAGDPLPEAPPPGPYPPPDPEAPEFTWQDVDGEDWTSPVTNQGQCGSCAIFAAVSTIEASLNVAFGDANLDYDLAEQYFLDCTPASCAEGTHHLVCLNQTLNHGVPDEACIPYVAADQDCAEICEDAPQRMVRAAGWGWVADYLLDEPTDEQIKQALAFGPVTTSMDVYSDYFGYVDGVYEPMEGLEVVGGHAVPIIGWNDDHDSWYCKNSWGTEWGHNGYFEIRRGAAGINGPFTTWLQMDASPIAGAFEVSDDEVEAEFVQGSCGVATRSVTLHRTAGEGDVPFWVSPGYDAGWLGIEPLSGTVGDEDVVIDFTFDESGYTQNPGAVTCTVEILGGHGLARVVVTRIVVMAGDGDVDTSACGDGDGGPPAAAPDPKCGDDGACGCVHAGARVGAPSLLDLALDALLGRFGR